MGSMMAMDLAGLAGTMFSLDEMLEIHLVSNHYPPIPRACVGAAKAAIEAVNDGDFDRPITLPDGVTYGDEATAPAGAVASEWHLEAFLAPDEQMCM